MSGRCKNSSPLTGIIHRTTMAADPGTSGILVEACSITAGLPARSPVAPASEAPRPCPLRRLAANPYE